MKLTHEEVRQVLSIISESSFDSIEIKMGEIAISASKSGPLRAESVAPAPPTPQAPVQTQQAEPPTPPRAAAAPKASDVADEGLIEVTSPMVGVFYIAPEPGADPFVAKGDLIEPDTTVGIIEVMKVFTSIRAEKTGRVVRCLVENGDFVEFGQPLLLLQPES